MVSRWGWPCTCYLAIKLEKFANCAAGQIVKHKLNNKRKSSLGIIAEKASQRGRMQEENYFETKFIVL